MKRKFDLNDLNGFDYYNVLLRIKRKNDQNAMLNG